MSVSKTRLTSERDANAFTRTRLINDVPKDTLMPEPSGITRSLMILEESISEAKSIFAALERQLELILLEPTPSCEDEVKEIYNPMCSLAAQILQYNRDVSNLIENMRDITRRLNLK